MQVAVTNSVCKRNDSMRDTAGFVSRLVLATMLFFTGCASIGPGTVTRDRFDYTTALSESWKSQMLLNIVKLRYGDAPIFLDVASVINSYEVSGATTLGLTAFTRPFSTEQLLEAEGRYANRPTITYTPLTGEKFARNLMSPVPASSILSLIQSGTPVDLVFRVLVQSINGVGNRFGGMVAAHSADPEFYLLLEKMMRIQAAGVMGLRIQKRDDGNATVIVFGGRTDEKIEEDVAEAKRILGLDPREREFHVVYGLVPSTNREVAILSRSMLQILVDLSSYIDVPESDVAEKRVNPAFQDALLAGGAPGTPLVRILSSSDRPDDAFVAVPYSKHWFWIDNKDLQSKQIFSFLMFVFSLSETGEKEGVPIVTVPAR